MVGGIRQKRALISEISSQKGVDVLFLQETHSSPADEVDWGLWWEGSYTLSHGTNFSAGVAVLFRTTVNATVLSFNKVVKGRLLIVRAEIESIVFCFVTVYGPNQGRERVVFFTLLKNKLIKYQQDHLIIAGDFNCTLDFIMDRIGEEPHLQSSQSLNTTITHLDLLDTWRVKHPQSRQYIWVRVSDNRVSAARLDRIYISKSHLHTLLH